eukprot:scaffold1593_cov193-Alexandrium_tamarense.AAC.64
MCLSLQDVSQTPRCIRTTRSSIPLSFHNISLAISMYEKFGYVTYRRVLGYYSGDDPEDAFDMRKALPRDVNKKSVIPMDRPVLPEELEW